MPKYPPPPPPAWDRFRDALAEAARLLEEGGPSPVEGLTREQVAVWMAWDALEPLTLAIDADEDVRLLILRVLTFFNHLSAGIPDALGVPRVARNSPKMQTAIARALIVRACDELSDGDKPAARTRNRSRDERWMDAAEAMSQALRRAGAPKSLSPVPETIRHWRRWSLTPDAISPAQRRLADVYRAISLPRRVGKTPDDLAAWLVALVATRAFEP